MAGVRRNAPAYPLNGAPQMRQKRALGSVVTWPLTQVRGRGAGGA